MRRFALPVKRALRTGVSGGRAPRLRRTGPARKVARMKASRTGGLFFAARAARYPALAGSEVCPRAVISESFAAFEVS